MIETAIAEDPDAMRWRRVHGAVHRWRGELIDLFAQAEAEVSEALLAMGCAANELLVGHRMARLAAAVAPGGSHAQTGVHVRGALASFQQHDALRHALCHGRSQIALDQKGKWIVVLRLIRLRAAVAERTAMVFDEAEALTSLQTVAASVRVLRGQLHRMRRVIAQPDISASEALGAQTDALLHSAP